MEGCYFVGIKLGRHLTSFHKMEQKTENYNDALKAARPYEPLTKEKLQSQRQQFARDAVRQEFSDEVMRNLADDEDVSEEPQKRFQDEVEATLRRFHVFLTSAEGNFREKKIQPYKQSRRYE